MNLYLRLLLTYLISSLSPRIRIKDTGTKTFRVLPTDLDLYRHMNNGRYFQIMDVARFSWLLKTGIIDVLRKNRWSALLGGGRIRFRMALKVFQTYTVSTSLICWDDRWYYLEHRFTDSRGRLLADAVVRAAFRSRTGWVSTATAMPLIDPGVEEMPMPASVSEWLASEDAPFREKADADAA